jgi:alanyl-tRNA synthetase
MTVQLFRSDAYMSSFIARVTEVRGLAVCLSETAFYPGGGGQVHDLGTLNGLVVQKISLEDHKIWHHLDSDLSLGTQVQGQLDWARRFDAMQQHTGEHLLGQAFFRLGRHVLAVNMEHSVCTLDLTEVTTWETAIQAEKIVNQMIVAALPISIYEVPDSEIQNVPLRRASKVQGLIRVVQIGDFDYTACGGTHTSKSSEVGLLKILKLERIKGTATRIYFNCGVRLLEDYRFKHDFISSLGLRFSSGLDQVPTRTVAALDELGQCKLEISQLRTQLAARIASSFLRGVVLHILQDAALLPELAKACVLRENLIAILGAVDGSRVLLAVTCGRNTKTQAKDILALGLPLIEGKGGGKSDLAQGSGLKTDGLEAALEVMRSLALEAIQSTITV